MGSLAGLLGARGIEVTGSDRALYPPMSTALANWGIEVIEGFHPENVLARRPDLVVIGNAVRDDNPEALAAIEAGRSASLRIVVITDTDAYWLDDDLPHVRAWAATA